MATKDEKLERLRKLSRKQMEVVFYFCRGMTDDEIMDKLGIVESKTLSARKTNIYKKLEIKVSDEKKQDYLFHEFCPVLLELISDENALARYRPRVVEEDESEIGEVSGPNGPLSLNIWYVLVLVILAAFIGFFLRPILQPVEAPTPITIIITATPDDFNTPPPSVAPTENPDGVGANPTDNPTDTAIPETPTTQPSETPVPTDTVTPLPPGFTFIDDFDDGLDPFWNRRFGAPLIVDGQLTSSEPLDLSLGDSSWKNYQIEFDFVGKFEDCDIGPNSSTLGIRAQDQSNMLVYVFSRCYQEWQDMVDGVWNKMPGTLHGGLRSPIHFVISVDGNEITYYNRSELLGSFIAEGYESGPVYLHVKPGASFDNFKVTFLP